MIAAAASWLPAPLSQLPEKVNGIDDRFGATTMELVWVANSLANAE